MSDKHCDKCSCKSFWKNFISVFIILGPAIYFGIKDQTVAMGLVITGGGLAVAFINIDKFSWFKAGGFEAKLDAAQKTIDKAYATSEELRKITGLFIENSISMLTVDGYYESIPVKTKQDMAKQMEEIINTLDEEKQNNLYKKLSDLNIVIGWNLLDTFLCLLTNEKYRTCKYELNNLRSKRWNSFKDLNKERYITKAEIEDIFKGVPLEPEIKMALDAYLEYIKK